MIVVKQGKVCVFNLAKFRNILLNLNVIVHGIKQNTKMVKPEMHQTSKIRIKHLPELRATITRE